MKKLFILFFLVGCVSRKEIEANLYQLDQIPTEVCDAYPIIQNYGIFRVIQCEKNSTIPECQHGEESYQEYIPYCSGRMNVFLAANKQKVIEWLDQLRRPKP